MQKPAGYDETEAKTQGEFETILPGGYVAKILNAIIKTSKNGNQMLELSLDVAEGEHAGFYATLSEKLNKDISLKVYQLTEGESTAYFKGLIETIEQSNPGFKFNFDEKALIGKRVGVNLREEEYMSGDEVKVSLKVGVVCTIQEIRAGVPLLKKRTLTTQKPVSTHVSEPRIAPMPDDKDLPF